EYSGTRRRGRRLRAGPGQRLAVRAGRHRLGASRYDAQAFQGALGGDVEALRRQSAAPLLQEALHALDGVAVFIEQRADAAQEVDVLRPVIPPPAAALERTDLAELAFPEPQHVLRHIEFGGDFADGAKRLCRLFNPSVCGL